MVGDGGLAVRPPHHLAQRSGGGIDTDVVEGLGARVALHVRLPGEYEGLERLGFRADGGQQHGFEEGGGGLHRWRYSVRPMRRAITRPCRDRPAAWREKEE
jgi:hypothetical protein